jgi:hypothetical protein
MENLWIVVPVAMWLIAGLVFISLCRAASRADAESNRALHRPGSPRTWKQHIFAIHARSLKSMRRAVPGRGHSARQGSGRDHGHHADSSFHSA